MINEQNNISNNYSSCSVTGEVNEDMWNETFTRAGVLQSTGDIMIALSTEFEIDPVLFAAIAFHETGWGTSRAVIVFNNPGGLMTAQGLMRFETLEEGLRATARTLHNRIIRDGNNTLEKLRDVYAPIGADNDPTGLNNNWIEGVSSIAEQLGGFTLNCTSPNVAEGDFLIPVSPVRVTSWFGIRQNPTGAGYEFHNGLDFGAPLGTPIKASKSGRVVVVSYSNVGYGNMIQIDHGDGTWTLYAHLNEIQVMEGQDVTQSEVIGTIGSTGNSTGPHLHFEIRMEFGGGQVDPKPLLGL